VSLLNGCKPHSRIPPESGTASCCVACHSRENNAKSSISGDFDAFGFPLEFIPWIPAFAGMVYGAGMTAIFATIITNLPHIITKVFLFFAD